MGKALNTYQKGRKGENRAAAYLRLRGYQVLERNYRVSQGEIDLIALRGETLVFVEVKSRKDNSHGTPLEAVSAQKVKRVSAAAAIYLAGYDKAYSVCRFDIIAVGPDKNFLGFLKVHHFEDAYSVDGHFNV